MVLKGYLFDYHEFLCCFGWEGLQRPGAVMVEDKGDCGSQVCDTCFACSALAVGTGKFRASGDVPRAVLLEDRCELIPHGCILAVAHWLPVLLGFAP